MKLDPIYKRKLKCPIVKLQISPVKLFHRDPYGILQQITIKIFNLVYLYFGKLQSYTLIDGLTQLNSIGRSIKWLPARQYESERTTAQIKRRNEK